MGGRSLFVWLASRKWGEVYSSWPGRRDGAYRRRLRTNSPRTLEFGWRDDAWSAAHTCNWQTKRAPDRALCAPSQTQAGEAKPRGNSRFRSTCWRLGRTQRNRPLPGVGLRIPALVVNADGAIASRQLAWVSTLECALFFVTYATRWQFLSGLLTGKPNEGPSLDLRKFNEHCPTSVNPHPGWPLCLCPCGLIPPAQRLPSKYRVMLAEVRAPPVLMQPLST